MRVLAQYFHPDHPHRWLFFLLLALFFHLFLFVFPWKNFLMTGHSLLPPKVEVKTVDSQTLEQIRQRWKSKSLVLNPNSPETKERPPEARYFSDRNTNVKKEQRARQTQVLPEPGSPGVNSPGQKASSSAASSQSKPVPNLTSLGVPLKLDQRKQVAQTGPDQKAIPAQRAGGDQAILDPNLEEGSQNLLNTEQSVYYSYYSRLYEAIGPLWQSHIRNAPVERRILPGTYVTQVDVVFNAEGELEEIRYLTRSGVAAFDQAVETSWRRIGRFPNPPKDLLDENGQVHTGWTFSVDLNQALEVYSPPPRRNY